MQHLIMEQNLWEFQRLVDTYLAGGAKVVPGTFYAGSMERVSRNQREATTPNQTVFDPIYSVVVED